MCFGIEMGTLLYIPPPLSFSLSLNLCLSLYLVSFEMEKMRQTSHSRHQLTIREPHNARVATDDVAAADRTDKKCIVATPSAELA